MNKISTPTRSVTRILVDHFFRRFFDNDTLQPDGDTQTTVVRAVAIAAIPGLMVAFWLQNHYPGRSTWASVADHYFFVLFSFIALGAVAVFEWEMLFPDRLDFLALTPLPVKPAQLLAAKATALLAFLGLFLVGSNIFGTLLLPLVSHFSIARHIAAHAAAVGLAGLFAACCWIALGGLLLCILPASQFRTVSPLVQTAAIATLLLFLLHFLRFGNALQPLLSEPFRSIALDAALLVSRPLRASAAGRRRACLRAQPMSVYALRGTAIAAAVACSIYPLAWSRMRRLALEGGSQRRREPAHWPAWLIHKIIHRPGERAMFHFIGQTIARNNRYQVYLAMYGGTGLALALSCAVTFHTAGSRVQPALSNIGLHAIMPLVLFWVVSGLRTAFAAPQNLTAGWIFRITGVSIEECQAAARHWSLACALAALACVVTALRLAHGDSRHLLVQLVAGVCLSILLTDALFSIQAGVPFNRPRRPGRTNLPLILTLYVGVLSPFIFAMMDLEAYLEKNLWRLLPLLITVATIHLAIRFTREKFSDIEEEIEGYEGEFQLLGLS